MTDASWFLGGERGTEKVVHVEGCRYAKLPYTWADKQGDVNALAKALYESGAWQWHHGCLFCNRPFNDAIVALFR